MKAIAVYPGKPNSIHLAELPKPALTEVDVLYGPREHVGFETAVESLAQSLDFLRHVHLRASTHGRGVPAPVKGDRGRQ